MFTAPSVVPQHEPLAIIGPGYQSYSISVSARVDLTNASNKLAAYASVCGRMTKLYHLRVIVIMIRTLD
eukprot:COSAG01_NODE_10694_length_2103_cov_2.049955_2_plen_69_part_00